MVYIIGSGAGDVELMTLKGKRLMETADVVIYAGSLVNADLLGFCKAGVERHDSAGMTLEEVMGVIEAAEGAGKMTVRLHTGDPSLYGAIQEQMDEMTRRGIAFEVVPGVSSFPAAAAALKQEYTLPGITQTVIITRHGGRTAVPERERLRNLAGHQTTICIFLSVKMIDEVVEELIAGGYTGDTPVAVVERASWADERIIRGTLSTIAEQVKGEGVERQAMIVVGYCLDTHMRQYQRSQLYSPKFSHMFRKAD